MRLPSVTFVAHEVRPDGGMERALFEIVSRLLARGHEVRLVARYSTLPDHPNLDYVRVPTPRRPFALAFPAFAAVAASRLSKDRSQVRVTLGAVVPSPATLAIIQFCHHGLDSSGTARRSVRGHVVGRLHDRVSRRLALDLERWCYQRRRLSGFLPVSPTLARELERYFPDVPVRQVIPNGVDLQRFRPDHERAQRVRERFGIMPADRVALFVGGDWARKGLDLALAAVADAPDWRLLVVGRGDAGGAAHRAAALGARADFVEPTPEVADFYCAADAFVLPSAYEGFALVTLEAAASGAPLVVTAATGAEDLAEGAGFVVERTVGAVSDALRALGDSAELRRQMSLRARLNAERYSWDAIADAFSRELVEASRG